MKKLIIFVLLIASIGASAQNQDVNPYGGRYYKDQSNIRGYGANGLPRTDHANLDTLTNVLKGDLRFDTLNSVVIVYDGTAWVDLAWSYSNSAILRQASLTITTAQVLALNTTPLEIIAAPPVGTAIEVTSAIMKLDFNTTQYATNTSLILENPSSTEMQCVNVINQAADAFSRFEFEFGATAGVQYVENEAVNLTTLTGDPTAGDSDITVYVTYRIITL